MDLGRLIYRHLISILSFISRDEIEWQRNLSMFGRLNVRSKWGELVVEFKTPPLKMARFHGVGAGKFTYLLGFLFPRAALILLNASN